MLSQSSLLGGILGPSPLLLEHFPIHLSPTELNCSVIQAVCYHLGYSPALSRPSMLHFPSLPAISSPGRGVNCAAVWSSGRENSMRQDWTGQSRTAFIRLKKTQPNSKPGPQPTFRIRKVLEPFPSFNLIGAEPCRRLGSWSSTAA